MKPIGIIGGGQLGMLLAMSITKLGAQVLIYDPNPQAPACLIFPSINADWQNKESLADFLSQCQIATYEFENISYESLAALNHATKIIPSINVLRITQNRSNEKGFLRSNNLPHVPYVQANNILQLETEINQLDFPIIIKSTTGGYDGKSQVMFKTKEELDSAIKDTSNKNNLLPPFPVVVEQAIDLYMEISCITACSLQKESIVFPAFENVHRNHILETTVVPATISPEISLAIQKLALEATSKLKIEGLLCTEFFISHKNKNIKSAYTIGDFNIYINEFAPRPHNSGHVTMLSCDFSQFDILAQILLSIPITSPQLLDNSYYCMLNLLGDIWLAEDGKARNNLNLNDCPPNNDSFALYLYGKKEARTGRKMGHLITKEASAQLAKQSAFLAKDQLITRFS